MLMLLELSMFRVLGMEVRTGAVTVDLNITSTKKDKIWKMGRLRGGISEVDMLPPQRLWQGREFHSESQGVRDRRSADLGC